MACGFYNIHGWIGQQAKSYLILEMPNSFHLTFFKNMLSQQILPIKCFRTIAALIFPINVKDNYLTCLSYVASYGPKSFQARKTVLGTSRICMA